MMRALSSPALSGRWGREYEVSLGLVLMSAGMAQRLQEHDHNREATLPARRVA